MKLTLIYLYQSSSISLFLLSRDKHCLCHSLQLQCKPWRHQWLWVSLRSAEQVYPRTLPLRSTADSNLVSTPSLPLDATIKLVISSLEWMKWFTFLVLLFSEYISAIQLQDHLTVRDPQRYKAYRMKKAVYDVNSSLLHLTQTAECTHIGW